MPSKMKREYWKNIETLYFDQIFMYHGFRKECIKFQNKYSNSYFMIWLLEISNNRNFVKVTMKSIPLYIQTGCIEIDNIFCNSDRSKQFKQRKTIA